jgi:hypothetical protein
MKQVTSFGIQIDLCVLRHGECGRRQQKGIFFELCGNQQYNVLIVESEILL